jgi:hypothetical protein
MNAVTKAAGLSVANPRAARYEKVLMVASDILDVLSSSDLELDEIKSAIEAVRAIATGKPQSTSAERMRRMRERLKEAA